jgi:chemotaxis protein methyltransferase CheR
MNPAPESSSEYYPPDLARILAVARERSGVDFQGYRPSTLERRVQSRMRALSTSTYAEYLELLREEPGEVDVLLNRLTIKVSRFFRNAETYRLLHAIMLERWRSARRDDGFTIWSAGCGHGEEPYSLAMLLSELSGPRPAGAVWGTDIDPAALEVARARCYPPETLEETPPSLRARYLAESRHPRRSYRVTDAVASLVTFQLHDLTAAAEPPWGGGFDLICCRNVLIYLTPAVQRRVLELLLASLAPGGHLCLGKAEQPCPPLLPLLEVVDRTARIFRLRAGGSPTSGSGDEGPGESSARRPQPGGERSSAKAPSALRGTASTSACDGDGRGGATPAAPRGNA